MGHRIRSGGGRQGDGGAPRWPTSRRPGAPAGAGKVPALSLRRVRHLAAVDGGAVAEDGGQDAQVRVARDRRGGEGDDRLLRALLDARLAAAACRASASPTGIGCRQVIWTLPLVVLAVTAPARAARPPNRSPAPLERGTRAYGLHCAACRGVTGPGDASAAAQLDPSSATV